MSRRRYDTHQRSPDDDSDDGYRDRERKSSRKESCSDRNSYKSKSAHVKEKYDKDENDSRKDYRTDSVNRRKEIKESSLEKDAAGDRKTIKRKKKQYSSEDENDSRKDYRTDSVNRRKEIKGSSLEKDAESDRKSIKRKKTQYSSEDENLSYNSKNSERRKQFQKDKEDNKTENEIDGDREKVKKNAKKYSERRTGFIFDDDSLEDEKCAANDKREKVKESSRKYTERRTGFICDDDSSGNEKTNNNCRSKASKKYSEESQSKTHTYVIGKDNYRGNERERNYYEKDNKTSVDAKDSSSEDVNVSYGSKSRDRTNYPEKILSKVTAVDKDNKHYTSKERYSGKITDNRKTVVDYSSEDENLNYSKANKERSKYSEKTSKSSKISEDDDEYYKIKSKEQKRKHSENKRSHNDAVESLSEGEIYSSRSKYSDKIRSKVTTAGIEDDRYKSKEGKNKHSEKKVIEIDISNNSTDDENYNSRKKERYSEKKRNKTSIVDVEDNEHRNRERKGSYSEKNRMVVDINNDSSGDEKYNRKRIKRSDQMKSKIVGDFSEDNHYRGKEERLMHSEKHRSVVDKESSSEDEDYSSKNKGKKYSGKIRSKVISNVQDSPYMDGKRKGTVSDKSRRVVDISDSSCEEETANNGSRNRPREKIYENEGSRHNKTWGNFEDNPSRSTDRKWKHLEKDTGKKNTEVDSESDLVNNRSKTNRHAEKPQQNVSSNEPQSKRVQIATINMRTGGAYIPPARLKMMQDQIKDKGSTEYQRIAWEALKKSIVGMTNKVNISNIADIVPELLKENIIRGRGVLARAVMQAQAASPSFTRVYAALVAIINTKFPEIGELILKRLILQYRRGFRRNDKTTCLAACRFIAQLFNQEVAHEILILEIATHLLEIPTEDSVEIAIAFLKECGQKLTQLSKNGMRAITDRIRDILHDSKIDARIRYMIEVYHAIQKDKFDSFKAVEAELDLVEESDKYTHLLNLDETVDGQDILNVFKFDPDYLENEEKYKSVVKEILGDSSGSEASGEDSDEEEQEGEDEGGEKKPEAMEITDMTETNVVCLRRKIYLTIQSSLDFEECAHKLLKLEFKPGQIVEMCYMILDCCAQQRTYEKFFGLLAQRFCQINKIYAEPFTDIFENSYKTIHRLETNKLRNVANFFAHLLYTDAISWMVLSNIRLNEEDTTSSSRVFIKILFQELCEYMGLKKLNERVQDVTFQEAFEGLFPRDHPHNTRFAINFFTSIGLGGLTDELREHLKNAPKKQAPPPPPVPEVDSGVPQSSESDSESESESEEERNARKRKKKSKKKKK